MAVIKLRWSAMKYENMVLEFYFFKSLHWAEHVLSTNSITDLNMYYILIMTVTGIIKGSTG